MEPSLKVLHLEDEPWDSEWVRGLLRRDGLAVEMERVETLPAFQQALARGGHALILSDFTIPGVDVLEALRWAREQRPELPFVFVSGTLGEDVAIEALKQGGTDYVLKQRIQRLGPAVRRALQQAQERRRLKQTQAELHAREEWLRLQSAALQAAANAISITDLAGTILWVNPAFERLTGYHAAELLGQNHRLLKSGRQDPAFYQSMWDTITAGRPWHGEVINKRKDGRLYNEEMTIAPVTDARGAITHFVAIKQDVSGRKRAEAQLQQSERSLRLQLELVGLAHDAVIVRRPGGAIVSWNRGAEEIYGWRAEEAIGRRTHELFHTTLAGSETGGAQLDELLAKEGHWEGELQHRRKDGSIITVESRQVVSRGLDGRPEFVLATNRDITKRKQVEEALRQSEERHRVTAEELQAIMDATPAGILVAHDPECHLITGNGPAHEVIGVPLEEENISATSIAQGASPYFRVFRQGREAKGAELPMQVAGATGAVVRDQELEVVRRDGTRRTMLVTAAPLYSSGGRVRGAVGALVDITERKQAEEALRESEQEFRALAESMPQLVWTTNAEGQVDYVNEQWCAYTGQTREEANGAGWARALHPEDGARTLEGWAAAAAAGQNYEMEYRLRNKEGGYRWFLARGVPLRDIQGRIHRWFGSTTDIDEQRRTLEALQASEQRLSEAKDQLARANEDLERRVNERTAELRDTIAEMEHMSYSMVHDLRAPLRAIQSFGGILEQDPESHLSPEGRELLARSRTAADRMDQLVCDVLNYSKVVRGRLPLEPVDLNALLHGMVATYPNLEPSRTAVEVAPDLPVVLGNRAALTQCFSQLLDNAVKFTKPGDRPTIQVRSEGGHRGWVRIVVEDKGIGIPPEVQDRVFGMFQRLSNAGTGTGMGLAIVKKAVERMGGRVGVESEPGQGSRFWVELPSAEGGVQKAE